MLTRASTVNEAIILVDVMHGLLNKLNETSFIISLLQISHIIVGINKIDLVDYS